MLSRNSRIVVLATILSLGVMNTSISPQATAKSSPPSFNRYLTHHLFKGKPAKLTTNSRDARDYQVQLQAAVKKGINFAGHYVIANNLDRAMGGRDTAAIIDVKTGKVYFPKELRGYHDQRGAGYTPPRPDGGLQYHTNSKLLIIVGLPANNNGKQGAGFYYYKWENNQLKFITFVSSPYPNN
jgi:hypothetical protein